MPKWTFSTLRIYFDTKLSALRKNLDERFATQTKALEAALAAAEKAVQAALVSAEKALAKLELAYDKRFESVNEFREQLRVQAAEFVTKAEFRAVISGLTEKIDELRTARATVEGREGGSDKDAATRRADIALRMSVIFGSISVVGIAASIIIAITS